MNTKNKYALITGATSGFGYEFSKLAARDGYGLILVARSEERLNEVSAELAQTYKVDVRTIAADLFEPMAAEFIFQQTSEQGLTVDVLINDAGQGEYGKFVDYEVSRDIDLIQLNVTSLVCLTKFYLHEMIARKSGKILQVASLLGKYPTPMMAVYAGTKSFVTSFTEALVHELEGTGVTVTALLPGGADTDFFHKAGAEETVVYRETELSSPVDVAKDGYEALMKGDNRVVSGLKNKIQAGMSAVMPDSALAFSMSKQMSPSEKEKGREEITHPASREERNRIQRETGSKVGDYENHEGHSHE